MHQISPPQCKHILSNTSLSLFAMECTHANYISLPLGHKKMALPDYEGIA